MCLLFLARTPCSTAFFAACALPTHHSKEIEMSETGSRGPHVHANSAGPGSEDPPLALVAPLAVAGAFAALAFGIVSVSIEWCQ